MVEVKKEEKTNDEEKVEGEAAQWTLPLYFHLQRRDNREKMKKQKSK